MKLFFKNSIGILVGLFLISNLISFGSLWALRQSQFYKPSFLAHGIEQTDFDYIVLGASTGLTTLNTRVIDNLSNMNGVNLAMDDTNLASQYLMLEHFLAEGKRTDFVVLAPSNSSYDTTLDKLSDNDYRFLPYVHRDYVYKHYSRFNDKQAKILKTSKWLPAAGLSYYNAELFYPSLFSAFNPERHNRFDALGNYTYPSKKNNSLQILNRTPFEVSFSNRYLEAIKTLCTQHSIQLICYLSPMKSKEAKFTNPNYLVINHSALLTDSQLFFDEIHVNTLGRQVCSERFASQLKQLKERYSLN